MEETGEKGSLIGEGRGVAEKRENLEDRGEKGPSREGGSRRLSLLLEEAKESVVRSPSSPVRVWPGVLAQLEPQAVY